MSHVGDSLCNQFRTSTFHFFKNFQKILSSRDSRIFTVMSHQMSHRVSYGFNDTSINKSQNLIIPNINYRYKQTIESILQNECSIRWCEKVC